MGKSSKKSKEKKEGSKKTRAPVFQWPGDSEGRFIDILEEYPSLWDTDWPGYTNRDHRQASLEAIKKHMGYGGSKYNCIVLD